MLLRSWILLRGGGDRRDLDAIRDEEGRVETETERTDFASVLRARVAFCALQEVASVQRFAVVWYTICMSNIRLTREDR